MRVEDLQPTLGPVIARSMDISKYWGAIVSIPKPMAAAGYELTYQIPSSVEEWLTAGEPAGQESN